ncbi:site-2 protease family protein [Paenibacillus solani]|uniref:site-2 protease family protein n=1 Tax=Paenibacillus solani TaxID=1705565 RepID=UPI003D2E93E5
MKFKKMLLPFPLFLMVFILGILLALLLPGKGVYFVIVPLCLFLFTIFIHEFGHFIVGVAKGLKPIEMNVGPLRLLFKKRSLQVLPNNNWQYFGGTIHFSASNSDYKGMARKWSWMALGGPAASLFTALLILLLFSSSPLWLDTLLLMNLGIGVVTLIPSTNGSFYSDGKHFWILRKESTRANLMMASVILQRDFSSKLIPSEWNPEVINASSHMLNNVIDRTTEQLIEESQLRMFLYYYFADKEQIDQAIKYIQPLVMLGNTSGFNTLVRIMIVSLYACHFFLQPSSDAQSRLEAESLVQSLPNKEPYSYHKAWAAMLSTQGKTKEAAEHLSQAQLLLEKWYKPIGTYQVEKKILSQIENRLIS